MKNLDKTAWIGILACIGLLIYSVSQSSKISQENFKKAREEQLQKEKEEAEALANAPDPPKTPAATPTNPSVAASATPQDAPATEVELATDKFKLTFTNRGAGIKQAQLLEHHRTLHSEGDYVTLNETRDDPIGAFSSEPNEMDQTNWVVQSQTDTSVTFATDTPEKLHIEKTYSLPDPSREYEVELDISIRNDSGAPVELKDTSARFIYAGGAAPLHFNEWPMQIGLFWDANYFKTKTVDYFGGKKKMLGVFGRSEKQFVYLPGEGELAENLSFAGVNDQFFAILIQAKEAYDGRVWANKFPVVIGDDKEKSIQKRMRGCELAMSMPNVALKPGFQQTIGYDFYIGPKEAAILKKSPKEWSQIMNYSNIPIFGKIFGWAISPLAAILSKGLVGIKGIVGNYGWAIVILTILVRLLMWPVYAKSTRSMKRMSKLTPLMKDIKEKYPDDPTKVNSETMKLYKEYGVNPMGGCLPMFLQLPVFLGFYRMLWGAVELRHESFLGFVHDLTMPDNLAMIPGLDMPLNILPILMSGASFVQMAMTPKTGDNTQRMIFMMMPVMFLVFCYNFASGLALYWTVSNVFTVLQTWLMNKLPEPELNKTKKAKSGKKGLFQKLQDQVEAAQSQKGGNANASGPKKSGSSSKKKAQPDPQPGQSRTKLASEKGSRHTKSKKKKR